MNTTPAPQPRTPWWIPLGVVCLVVTFFGWLWWPRDDPPPDVSDFTFEPLDLREDQNAYALLTKAYTSLPERKWTDAEDDALVRMQNGDAWDESIAEVLRSDFVHARPLLEQASRVSLSQAPLMKTPWDATPETFRLFSFFRTVQISAIDQARSGKTAEGLHTALLGLTAGKKVEESRGALIHYILGGAGKLMSLNAAHRIIRDDSPSYDSLQSALRTITDSRSSPEALSSVLYHELHAFKNGLSDVHRMLDQDRAKPSGEAHLHILPRALVLMPNRTHREYMEFIRSTVALIDAPQKELDAAPTYTGDSSNRLRALKNKFGRELLSNITTAILGIVRNRLRVQSTISAHEAWTACHLYHRDHGEFPATLDALVPDYLPAVPRDYIDGEPIRYSRDLGVIWSIGEKNLQITASDQVVEERETVLRLTSDVARASRP